MIASPHRRSSAASSVDGARPIGVAVQVITVPGNFTTSASGWCDTALTGLVSLLNTASTRLHAIVGVSLPTDSRLVVGLQYTFGSGSRDPGV